MVTKPHLYIDPLDEVNILVQSEDRGINHELNEYFKFKVKGAEFTPAYRNKFWDGYIRLYNESTGRIYKGLMQYVIDFCIERNYTYLINDELVINKDKIDIDTFCESLKLDMVINGTPLVHHDYQKDAIKQTINEERITLLSPTSSGKTLTVYSIIRYYFDRTPKKILMIVPNVGLVLQGMKDFQNYSSTFDVAKNVHPIYQGQAKVTDKKIIISTYQSIYEMPEKFFNQFDVIIQDECHLVDAQTIKGIFEKAKTVKYKIGCTGTLEETKCHQLVIQGLLGKVYKVVSTKQLMDDGTVSDLTVNCMILKYSKDVIKANKKFKYQEEIDFIINNLKRNQFIAQLAVAVSKDKNTLILTDFHKKRKHIELMAEEISKISKKRVLIVKGDIDPIEREKIKAIIEANTNIIVIATYGCYSTGVSINNLQNIILATNSKSQIKVLQSIGRGLRLDGGDNVIKVFDIADDFSVPTKKNYLFQHFFERVKIYIKEEFKYKTKTINIL